MILDEIHLLGADRGPILEVVSYFPSDFHIYAQYFFFNFFFFSF